MTGKEKRSEQGAVAAQRKDSLCLFCSHESMSVADDFADCICAVSGGYKGGRTECESFERRCRE